MHYLDIQPELSRSFLAVTKIMWILVEGTYWIFSAAMLSMTLFQKCKPPLLGSMLLCGIPTNTSIWLGPLLGGFEFIMGMQIIVAGAHPTCYSQISGLVLLWGRFQEFLRMTRSLTEDILMTRYREQQIWERIHNSSYRGKVLPVSITGIPTMEILSGAALITVFQSGNWFQISVFLIFYVDAAVFAIIILTSASAIYVKSEDWIKGLKSEAGFKNPYFRRVQKSFRPLRLEFGDNFVDKLTPLVLQEYCNRQTATLTLLLGG